MASDDRSRDIVIDAVDGPLSAHYCGGDTITRAVLWLDAGASGETVPVAALARGLAAGLRIEDVSTLDLPLADVADPGRTVRDARAGLAWLEGHGAIAIAVVAGGPAAALAVELALASAAVRALVLIAPSGGEQGIERLGSRCAVLVIERKVDAVAPATPGISLDRVVDEPRRLVLAEGGGHDLDESTGEVAAAVRGWIVGYLGAGAELSGPAPGIPKGDELYN